ncbi:MAG: membrane protein insertase YidC [Arenicella sp.]|jgi:YidC/Oxa1 family membrane protein insertase|nr:membrane protein insertase YidC [Arenicella sp.]
METYRTALIFLLAALSTVLYTKWLDYSAQDTALNSGVNTEVTLSELPGVAGSLPAVPIEAPNASADSLPSINEELETGSVAIDEAPDSQGQLVRVETDLLIAYINTVGGTLERVETKLLPVAIDQQDQGYAVLRKSPEETFIIQDGLLLRGGAESPNHLSTYAATSESYTLGSDDSVEVPLTWTSESGAVVTKTLRFRRDSYLVGINYEVNNISTQPWVSYLYSQFNRSAPVGKSGGFGQIPSYTGGAIYTEEEKYEKITFDDIDEANLDRQEVGGWVSMMEHYFVAVFIPEVPNNKFYSSKSGDRFILGLRASDALQVAPNSIGSVGTTVFLGPKEQARLKDIEEEKGIEGLPLTVDFGMLTVIADPLFWLLDKIHAVVGNWGWSIILLTLLIKIFFYPLSAASYKSMAGMKKLQPRIATLKERYKDDRQKFQMEMMALYKKEKINPAGGCLPILIQIPVFIALYWTLLESVEIRQAPFALWLNDLSAPDPFYVLPILMGVSMWAQQKLNPAPMDDIQKKVMMIMPFALTLLFLTFPAGLVLYWVVNNVLSMAQQWYINQKHAK